MNSNEQLHVTELVKGLLIKHEFFASKIEDSEANLLDSSSVLYTYGNPRDLRKSLMNEANIVNFKNETIFSAKVTLRDINLETLNTKATLDSQNAGKDVIPLSFKSNNFNHFIIHQISYSNKGVRLKDVWSNYRKAFNSSISDDELKRLTQEFYGSVKDTDMFLIKKQNVKPFPKTCFKSYYKVSSFK